MSGNFTLDELKQGISGVFVDDAAYKRGVLEDVKLELRERGLDKEPIELFWAVELEVFKRFALGKGQSFEQFYPDRSISYAIMADILYSYLKDMASVVEVGCGSGKCLTYLSDRGVSVTGLDKSRIALEYLTFLAKAQNVNVEILYGDFFSMPLQQNDFDFAFNIAVIEHFEAEKQVELVRRMLRTSRIGILIAVPNKGCPVRRTVLEDYANLPPELGYPEEHHPVDLDILLQRLCMQAHKKDGFNLLPSRINPTFLDADGIDFYTRRLPRVDFIGEVSKYTKEWLEVEKRVDPADRMKYGWYNYVVLMKNG